MSKGRAEGAPRRFFDLRPGEERLARLFFWYFFLLAAPQTVIKTLRTADFLVKEGVGGLPVVYFLTAIVTGLVVLFHSKTQHRASLHATIVGSLVVFAGSGLVLFAILGTEAAARSRAVSYLYWVWASVLTITLLTHFWMVVNEAYNPRQAKRLVAYIGTGGVLGGVAGGLLTGLMTQAGLEGLLLPVACAGLVATILIVRTIFAAHPAIAHHARHPAPEAVTSGRKPGFWDSFHAVRSNTFLSLLAGLVAVGAIVSTCIEFQFLAAAHFEFQERPDALLAFLGFFEPGLTVFVLLVNVLITGFVVKKLAMKGTLLLTPGVLAAASLAVLALPFGLVSGLFVRSFDESMTFSVSQSVREVLFIPVASRLRHRAKPFIDMFVSQFAKIAAAAVLVLFALALKTPVKGWSPVFDQGLARKLSWVVMAFLLVWALLSLKAGKEYLATIKGNIHPLWERAEAKVRETIDREQVLLVFDTIDSRNYSAVLYALHLFDLMARDMLTPEVRALIAEKTGEVRAAAVSGRLGAEGTARFPDDLAPQGLLTEIPLIMTSDAYQQVMTEYLEKVMTERGPEAEVRKMELAKLIGLQRPSTPLAARLGRLIVDASPRVSGLALKSAARLRRRDHLPAVIQKLDSYVTLEDAIETLLRYGDAAVPALEKSLKDRRAGTILRRAAAEALARIGTRAAARALAHELQHGRGDIDEVVIDALDRVHSGPGEVHVSAAVAKRKMLSLVRKYCQAYLDLEPGGGTGEHSDRKLGPEAPLEAYLADIFKLLGLHYPHKDVRTAYQNIKAGDRHSMAHALEWLENALKKDMREAILPIVEDLSPAEKRRRFEKMLRTLPAE